MIWAHSK
nr:unnamed protein product [Timema shepardi]